MGCVILCLQVWECFIVDVGNECWMEAVVEEIRICGVGPLGSLLLVISTIYMASNQCKPSSWANRRICLTVWFVLSA